MVNETARGFDEVIKCVVVGDSGVGKTCLTCSFACNAKYTIRQLVKTHQATVWAIDHYQHDREILDKSWYDIDGCHVSIRIWDTFGYHDKDRRFAYRGADVVVLCFSVLQPNSLRNIRKLWHPEVRRISPTTPIVVCGTQADLRYMCFDEEYINMEKGLLYRNISPKDIITPAAGREVANAIGAPYYETSVLTCHGVADVIINAARLALIENRKIKFWNTQLRKVQYPLIQPPMKMPTPSFPKIEIPSTLLNSDISALLNNKTECDVTFLVRNETFEVHRICLTVASTFFHDLFSLESLAKLPAKRRKNQHLRSKFPHRFSQSDNDSFHYAEEHSPGADTGYSSSLQSSVGEGFFCSFSQVQSHDYLKIPFIIPYDHQAVEKIEIRYDEDSTDPSHKTLQTYVTMREDISPATFRIIIEYLYTGSLRPCEVYLKEVRKTAELLQLTDLMVVIDNVLSHQEFMNLEIDKHFHKNRIRKLRELALNKDFLSDISFEVDNGVVSAHKALLMGRCEMMFAMFSSNFIESASDVIPFPGISVETFRALKEYLYTGESPCMIGMDCVTLLEVANRLCLTRLVNMVEASMVDELMSYDDKDEMLQDVMTLLEPAELYNATQLQKFCEYTLSVNYHDVIAKHQKLFKALPQEKQDFIENKCWPPAWYLKEIEQYERLIQPSCKKKGQQNYSRRLGWLCFSCQGPRRK